MPPVNGSNEKAWLRDARSDLALAGIRKTGRIRYTHLCFHAQQAAEKSMKAIFVHHGLPVPRTHDIAFLMDQMPSTIVLPLDLLQMPVLTKYAVQLRYPGQEIVLKRRDYLTALTLADAAVRWAARICRQ